MGFCGACGKQAGNEDKFCTYCGTPIIESKITVMEETGEIIKEQYRVNTSTPVGLSRTLIGDKKTIPEKQNNEDYNIMIKYSFYTINLEAYVGKFDIMNIVDEIETSLDDLPIRIIDKKFELQKNIYGQKYYKTVSL